MIRTIGLYAVNICSPHIATVHLSMLPLALYTYRCHFGITGPQHPKCPCINLAYPVHIAFIFLLLVFRAIKVATTQLATEVPRPAASLIVATRQDILEAISEPCVPDTCLFTVLDAPHETTSQENTAQFPLHLMLQCITLAFSRLGGNCDSLYIVSPATRENIFTSFISFPLKYG